MMNQQEQQQEQERQLNQYIGKLVSGQIKASNKFVEKLTLQVRQAQADRDALRNQIDQFEADLKVMKERRLVLGGVIQQLAANIAEWKDYTDPKTSEEEAKDDGGKTKPEHKGNGATRANA